MDTKEVILENTIKLFTRKGYEAVSEHDVCTESNITEEKLREYFPSKKEILSEVLDRYFNEMDSTVKSATRYSGDLSTTLERTVFAYFEFAKANKEFYRMQLALVFGPSESEATTAVIARMTPQYMYTGEMFWQSTAQHGNMKGREKMLSATFIGMINTYISFYLHGQTNLDNQEVFYAVRQFVHGILS